MKFLFALLLVFLLGAPGFALADPTLTFKVSGHDQVAGASAYGYAVALEGEVAVISSPTDSLSLGGGVTVEDRGSLYVMRRAGGVWTLEQRLFSQDGGEAEYLGVAVAISGETIVAGTASNSAVVFRLQNGVWQQQARLTANDAGSHDGFGWSVAIDVDTIVVGARNDTVNAEFGAGSAYVFEWDPNAGWQQTWKFALDPAVTNNRGFGASVAVHGDVAAIGAPLSADPAGHGAVYVYARSAGAWGLGQILGVQGAPGEGFGSAVALDTDALVVTAQWDVTGGVQRGAAYVYHRPFSQFFVLQQKLLPAGSEDRFGSAVDISGSTLIVGAKFDDVGGADKHGAAHVFERVGSIWSSVAELTSPGAQPFDYSGSGVAISGNFALIASGWSESVPLTQPGKAYSFEKVAAGWTFDQTLEGLDATAAARFGQVVAQSESLMVVGAPMDDPGGRADQGSIYVFDLSTPAPHVAIKYSTGNIGDQFGAAIAVVGNRLFVGAPGADSNGVDAGAVYTIDFANGKLSIVATNVGGLPSDRYGTAVAASAQFVAIGAPQADVAAQTDAGAVWLYDSASLQSFGSLTSPNPQAAARFGSSLALSENRLVVGEPFADSAAIQNEGRVEIFAWNGSTWSHSFTRSNPQPGSQELFGSDVDVLQNQLVVGAPGDEAGLIMNTGAVWSFVHDPGSDAWTDALQLVPNNVAPDSELGRSLDISPLGLLIGCRLCELDDRGKAFFYTSVQARWDHVITIGPVTAQPGDEFGSAVSLGESYGLIGVPRDDVSGLADSGSAWILGGFVVPPLSDEIFRDGFEDAASVKAGHHAWWSGALWH